MNRKPLNKGQRIGQRIVLEEDGRTPNGYIRYKVQCDCGQIDTVNGSYLKSGRANRCKYCQHKSKGSDHYAFKHGQSYWRRRSRGYQTWISMRARCNNKNDPQYKDYGGRGITVCQEWNDFETFIKDMGERPGNLQLDRIDNNKGYCKENCRWANVRQQQYNKRTTKYYNINGVKMKTFEVMNITGWTRNQLVNKCRRRGEESVVREIESTFILRRH